MSLESPKDFPDREAVEMPNYQVIKPGYSDRNIKKERKNELVSKTLDLDTRRREASM